MKNLHTSILDTLLNYLNFDIAVELADNALEFGLVDLEPNLIDYLNDYFGLSKSVRITNEAILNIKK
jgi:hypothetical protein